MAAYCYRLFIILLPPFFIAVTAVAQPRAVPVDTRGPVTTAGMNVRINEGVEAPGYTVPVYKEKKSWSAKWINAGAPLVKDAAATLLRKQIILDEKPRHFWVWMTARNYLLFVNGRQAARGPADFGHDYEGIPSGKWMYDCRDLAALLHKGINEIAVELFDGNFLFEASAMYANGKTASFLSDKSWKGTTCSFLKNLGALTFLADEEPVNWQLAAFRDASWPYCKEQAAPAEPLVLSCLPPLMEARYPVQSITIDSGNVQVPDHPFADGKPVVIAADARFSIHLDKVIAGRCGIQVIGVKGTRIRLEAGEKPGSDRRVYDLVLRDGLQYFEAPDYYATGTVDVTVSHVSKPVEIRDISAVYAAQPVVYNASFTCSDDYLNKLWKSGRWSTQICMMTHHLDSPHNQEPICDYGDYLIEDLVNYCSMNNNTALAKLDLRKFAWVMDNGNYQTFHTSYTLLWLQTLLNYYDYTGDKSLVVELAPYVHKLISRFITYIGKNGLISEARDYMFMDWVDVHGIACHHPPAVIGQGYMTAFFYRAVADAQRVAQLTGNHTFDGRYASLRTQIKEAYNRELWNADKGLYRDGKPFVTSVKPGTWLPADSAIETFSVQNNTLAVLYDLAAPGRQAGIINRLMVDTPLNATPYFMHFVLSAIHHAGLFDKYGTSLMRTWYIHPETQTVSEMGNRGDLSHGWVATPVYQMSSNILGIQSPAAGFDTFNIKPELCDLSFAKGTVPSPHGAIAVNWQKKAQGFSLTVTIPAGTVANVAFPVKKVQQPVIFVNRQKAWLGNRAAAAFAHTAKQSTNDVTFTLKPGTYELFCPNNGGIATNIHSN